MNAKKLVVGSAAAAVLVVSGGAVAFAQGQDAQGGQGRSGAQEQPANPGGSERDCPWDERRGGSGETEV